MKDTLSCLSDILETERGVDPKAVSKASYKVLIEFRNKPKTVGARKTFLRRVIEESLI